jgi:molecular chaperone GrpE
MSDEQRANGGGAEPQVKVHDRRRFTPEGEPVTGTDDPRRDPEPKAELPAPDPRDETIEKQAARIDELMRALAATVDEGRAARSRMEREKTRVIEAERAQVAQVLLDAVDELERALAAAGAERGPLVDGVRLTLASLSKKVADLGAVRLDVVGHHFDPHLSEAIDLVPVSDPGQDDVVVQEVRAGYRIGERVLRPARVRVGRLARA